MDLLKLLIGTSKTVDPCFLCFKNDKNNLDIHTVFEIRTGCDVISLSLADMLYHLFPSGDFLFMQACDNCSDLISKLYTLFHNRKSKILLLECIVKQLAIRTNDVCSTSVPNDKLLFKIQLPLHKGPNFEDLISSESYGKSTLSKDFPLGKSYESTDLNRDTQVLQICQYCSEIFLEADELTSHMKIHRKKRHRRRVYHHCNNCNYKTLTKTTLQAHINKNHLNTRPHICHVCYKGFYNRSNLNEHLKTHNNERNQVCELCGCSFIHKKSLIEHLRLHSDTRPYECDICHKSFVTSGRRSDHIKRSHMEKTECCLMCNKKYSLKKELTRHMKNVHLRSM